MITFDRVSFGYSDQHQVLDTVSLSVGPGLTLLVGPNGAGKSTLLRLAAGVDAPQQGTISVCGHDLWQEEVAARRSLAYVPEHPDITPYATIGEVLELVAGLRGETAASVGHALAWAGLDRLRDRTVRELSKGQRRRAMVAAAAIGNPSCLILDEPLDGMDQDFSDRLLQWIEDRLRQGAGVLLATHQIAEMAPMTHRAVTIAGGRCTCLDQLPAEPAARIDAVRALARNRPDPGPAET